MNAITGQTAIICGCLGHHDCELTEHKVCV